MRGQYLRRLKNRSTRLRARYRSGLKQMGFCNCVSGDVGPRALFVDERPDPVCIVATIGEHFCLQLQACQQRRTQPVITRLARCSSESHWQSISVNNEMKFARQSASRSANQMASNTSGMLVDAHHRRVDHLYRVVVCGSQCVQVRSALRTRLGELRTEAQRKGPERQHPGGCGDCQRGLAPDVKGGEQAGCRGDDDGGVDQLR